MIEEHLKIHDKFSLELKLGFLAKEDDVNEFSVNTWIFMPNSLDINRWNYSKDDFYRDLKSNIRLITPVYTLEEIANRQEDPYSQLEKAFKQLEGAPSRETAGAYEYHIRMFLSILKSALREDIAFIVKNEDKADNRLTGLYIRNITTIAGHYRALQPLVDKPDTRDRLFNYFLFGDEFMSNLIEQHTFKLIAGLRRYSKLASDEASSLMDLIRKEIEYKREKGFLFVQKNTRNHNRDLVFRLSLLKKYAENELFLESAKRRDGLLAEQLSLSIAAGISMIFATAIAFSFQRQYGNLTMPFFVALVVSYMLKDRIKELARNMLAHRLGRRFFDTKTVISVNEHKIGWLKEGMDFISERKVPAEVIRIRQRSAILEADNRNNKEQIILYRKLVRLNRGSLSKVSPYPTAGMNDIVKINVSNYIRKMDNPFIPLYVPLENDRIGVVKGEKMYYLNLIMQFKHSDGIRFKRYRIVMNRKGIREVESF